MSHIEKLDNLATIVPGKDLAAASAQEFRENLRALIEGGANQLTVDLKEVEIIDSIGLEAIAAAHNSLQAVGGKLVIILDSKRIHGLLKVMGLDQHCEVKFHAN